MKQIKLEVGKNYRNRNGEEVKIVEKDNIKDYPFQGSNRKWYTESGQWCNMKSHHDLIEEVPETRQTFAIPEGVRRVTVEQVGNRIVVEMVPEKEPKPGDVLVNEQGNVYIFKSVVDGDTHAHCSWLGKSGSLAIVGTCNPGRPATPEEAQLLFDALKKAGKRWNPETMQVEDVPEVDAAERCRIMDYLQGYANNVTWNYEQLCWLIEGYLMRKEGENMGE